MELIKNILKGMVIGLANIIPGVSGGTLMVSMNIYDKLIHAINHLFSQFKKSMGLLIPVFIGMGLAIVLSSKLLEDVLFAKFPIQTNLLFIGLIVGGLPAILRKVKGHKTNVLHIFLFAVFFIGVVVAAYMGGGEGAAASTQVNLVNILMFFAVGIVASATMVIPGVSGSMVLLLMGYYNPVLSLVNGFISSLTAGDWAGVLQRCALLVPFGLGVVFGIFAIAKLIDYIFTKAPTYAFWAIIGLIVASPVAIVLMNLSAFTTIGVVSAATGLVALALGIFIAMKLGE